MAEKKSDLPLVPESILRKRHDLEELVRKRKESEAQKRDKAGPKKKTFYVKKPETFLSRGRSLRNNQIRHNRVLKKGMQKRASNKPEHAVKVIESGKEVTEIKYQKNSVGASMVFAVRIRDNLGIPAETKKVLRKFRLFQQHRGVFLKYDEETRKSLHLVEPWVVYGPPSKAVVEDIIVRRGHGRVRNERIPLSDNLVIEEALGEYNIICVEDLVEEIFTVGSHFQEAARFLAPIDVADSKSKFERGTLKLKDGKDYGDKGEGINDYIKQVL